MSDDKSGVELKQAQALVDQDLVPEMEKLDAEAQSKFLSMAQAQGWSPSQADWIAKLAQQPFLQAVVDGTPGQKALQDSFAAACRRLSIGYYENAIAEGKNVYTAFLTVIDLERQVTERRGDTPLRYPDAVLMQACEAAQIAADRDLSTEDQIAAGFVVLNGTVTH